MQKIHPRMPVILPKEAEKLWLDPDIKDEATLYKLLSPFSADMMDMYQISTAVNSVSNDNPNLITPVEPVKARTLF
jgi:putative SOS response-associated peptidase YedK